MNKRNKIILIILVIIVVILLVNYSIKFSNRINDLEYKINNLPSNSPSNSNILTTFLVEAPGNSPIVCCPPGSVRTGCTMESISSYPYSAVYPINGECCEGNRVKNLWAICLDN